VCETGQAGGIALFNYSHRRDDNTIRFGFNIYFNGASAPPRRGVLIIK
jgi:hypothetical protein